MISAQAKWGHPAYIGKTRIEEAETNRYDIKHAGYEAADLQVLWITTLMINT